MIDFTKLQNIAVVRRNGFGDLLCSLPLLAFLREKAPQAKLTLFLDRRNAPLLPYLPLLDHTVIFPAKGNKYWNLLCIALRHRSERFDLAISAKTSPMKLMNLFLFALGAKERIAMVDESWHRRLINRGQLYDANKAKSAHQALKGLRMVAPELNEVPDRFYPRIAIPEEIHQRYKQEHSRLIASKLPLLLLSASTTRESNRIEEKKYASLVNRLAENYPLRVLVIGEKKDRKRAATIASHLDAPHDLYFPRNFDEFMVLLGLSDFYFLGDGGTAHIGAALGKPMVVLFGETMPVEWCPLGLKVRVLYHPLNVNLLSEEEIFVALRSDFGSEYGRKHRGSEL